MNSKKGRWFRKEFDLKEYRERAELFRNKMSAELALDISRFFFDFNLEILRNIKINTDI